MSLFKRAFVCVSVALLAAPIVASGTVGAVSAATTDNHIRTTEPAKPNSNLKTPLRDANSIFNLRLKKQNGGYAFVCSIVASGNNVIQKGEKLVVSFDRQNVDLKHSTVINQKGDVPYTATKDTNNDTLTLSFNRNVDYGNYQIAMGIATKNVYTTTKVTAKFAGSPVKIAHDQLTSKWHQPQMTKSTTTTQQTARYSKTQSYSPASQTSQTATTQTTSTQTQAATQPTYQQSSNRAYSTTTRQTTGYKTVTQARTQQQQQQQQQQSSSQNNYTPTFDEARQAVMSRTTVGISGTPTTNGSGQTPTDSTAGATEKNLTGANGTDSTSTSSTDSTTKSASTGQASPQASSAQAAPTSRRQVQVAGTDNQQTSSQTNQESGATETASTPTTPATPTTHTESSQVQPQAALEQQVQAGAAVSNVIQTPDGRASDPHETLKQALADQNQAGQNQNKAYQSNQSFESIRTDVANKVPNADAEEQAEVVKTLPWIWSYISNAPTQAQTFSFETRLSTGRIANTFVNGAANTNSDNILQQNMPKLLKVFGANISANAFDRAMDIDNLLKSQVYQDYLQGKDASSSEKLNSNDAWKAINGRLNVTKVDASTNVAGATELPKTFYNPKTTVDQMASASLAAHNAGQSGNVEPIAQAANSRAAGQSTNDSGNKDSANLFYKIQSDLYKKMGNASSDDKAQMLGAIPDILHQVSNGTSSSDKTGRIFKFLKSAMDGSEFLFTVDTRPVVGSTDKYLSNLPQIFKSFGDSMRKGDFDKAINMQLMKKSQVYQDYLDKKYVPDALKRKVVQKNDKTDLLAAIILAIIAVPVLAILMPIIAIVTAPIWIPIALVVFTVVFAVTALPILLLTLGILASPFILPIAAIFTIAAALIGLVVNLIPIVNLITIPITFLAVVAGAIVTVLSVIGILLWLPAIIVTGIVVILAIAVPIVMFVALIALQIFAGIVALAIGLLPILVPILALIGIVIACIFAGIGLLLFTLSPLLFFALPLILFVIVAAILVVALMAIFFIFTAGSVSTILGILLIVLILYPIFNIIALVGAVLLFLLLVAVMPMFLVLRFLLFFIGFGFMALIFTDLAIPVLGIAIIVGLAMMTLFIPGLLIALSWPFWMSLVLLITVPIIIPLVLLGFIPFVGWIMGPVAGIAILIQAGLLIASIVVPIMIGLAMMTTGIIGFDIAAAAAAVLALLKDKLIEKNLYVDIDDRLDNFKIRPTGFWTKDDPLSFA